MIEQNAVQSEVTRPRNEAMVDREDAAHFLLWPKEGRGGFKSATETEDADGAQDTELLR